MHYFHRMTTYRLNVRRRNKGYFRDASSLCEAGGIETFKSTSGEAACSLCPADMTTLSTASFSAANKLAHSFHSTKDAGPIMQEGS